MELSEVGYPVTLTPSRAGRKISTDAILHAPRRISLANLCHCDPYSALFVCTSPTGQIGE